MQWSIEQSDAVTAVSSYLRDETYRQIPVKKEIEVVYNFIDPDRHDVGEPRCLPKKDPIASSPSCTSPISGP